MPVPSTTLRAVCVLPSLSATEKAEKLPCPTGVIEVTVALLKWAVGYLEICSRAKARNAAGGVPTPVSGERYDLLNSAYRHCQ